MSGELADSPGCRRRQPAPRSLHCAPRSAPPLSPPAQRGLPGTPRHWTRRPGPLTRRALPDQVGAGVPVLPPGSIGIPIQTKLTCGLFSTQNNTMSCGRLPSWAAARDPCREPSPRGDELFKRVSPVYQIISGKRRESEHDVRLATVS